jgi:tetratricopeptide (TPR) repeat protein
MRKRLNLRFALYLTASLLVLGTATHFLHGYQLRRNAAVLRDRAEQAERDGRLDLAADYFGRYVALEPGDTPTQARFALLLADEKLLKSPQARFRAMLALEKVLYSNPDRHDVRRRVVRLAMDLRRFSDAAADIKDRLLPAFPNDAELEQLLGRCDEQTGNYQQARRWYEDSIRHAPSEVETYRLLAMLLRQHTQEVLRAKEKPADVLAQADAVMADMVQTNERSYRAYLLRASYRRTFAGSAGDREADVLLAAADVARAQELAPEEADVLLAAADWALSGDNPQRDPRKARGLLEQGCERHAQDWRMYQALARLESAEGQTDRAVACLGRGLEKLPHQVDLLWDLAEQLAAAGRREQAADAISRLAREGFPGAELNYLHARLFMREERWRPAIERLESAYPMLIGRANQPGDGLAAELSQRCGLMLGQCYEAVGDLDRSHAAYGRVVARDGRSAAGRLGMAATRAAQGRIPEALDLYVQLMRLQDAPAGGWAEIARLVLQRNLGRAEDQRNWPEVDGALAQAERLQPLPPLVALLRAEYFAAQGQFDKARKSLTDRYGDPKARPPEVWAGMALLEERQQHPSAALALLDEARRQFGDVAELRLARANYWVRNGRDKAATVLPPLAEGLDRFTPDERRRLLNGLATASVQAGLTADAERLWRRLAVERPGDLRVRIALFDLAALAGDVAKMEQLQGEMREVEGEEGMLWVYARLTTLLGRAQRGDKSVLPEARRLLTTLATRRPEWSRVPLCEARLNELQDHPDLDAALRCYLRAIQLGESDLLALRRAVELLYERNRYPEAYDLLRRVPDQASLPNLTQRVAAEVALHSQDRSRALSLAQAAVAADSKDYRDHLWLGRVYWAGGQPARAEAALLRARELAPTAPETWVALVQFLAATEKTEKKERAREEVEAAHRRLTGGPAALALAACHELVGDKDRAAELYQAALGAARDDAATLRGAAAFYLRTNRVKEAQELLLRLSRHPDREASGWARRTRAVLLSAEGNPDKLAEALAQVGGASDGSPEGGQEAVANRRTRAQVLALQNSRPQRRAAAQILEGLIEEKVATPADHLLAAQLYEAVGDWSKARGRYLGLLAMPGGVGPDALAVAARSLLRHGDADAAAPAVKRLEALAPPQALATKELQARLLHLGGRGREAVTLLQGSAPAGGPGLQAVAGVLEELGESDAAEQAYRSLAAQPQRPEDALPLAQYLIRRERFGEALDLCDRCWQSCPPEAVAQVCVFAFSAMPPDPARLERVAGRLEAAVAAAPERVNLLAALAAVRNFQGRFDQAEAMYREVLRKNDHHATALNNLAWLLAVKGGHGEEALQLINRAAELTADDPGLLDTRAVAYLSLRQRDAAERAVKELEAALAEAPAGDYWFHLAQAHLALGHRKEAAQSWHKAQSLGLTAQRLHPLERPAFEELSRTMR